MYRVLIVDDEAFITDSLAFMLENQREPELEVIKTYSAPEAIDMLNRTAFHIVVTDVEMPGQSGVDLLKEIHVKWPSCQVVFLTGHDNFQYAHQAMRYNVVRYVLKNEGDDILLEAITECIRRIKKEQASTGCPLNTSTVNGHRAEKGGRELMWRHMESRQALNGLAAQWKATKLCLSPDKGVMLMAGCTRDLISEDTLDALHSIVTAKIGHAVLSEAVSMGEKLCIWFMQPTEKGNRIHALAAIKGLAENIQEAVRSSLSLRVTFILDEEEISWQMAPERLEALQGIARKHLEEYTGIALAGSRFFTEQQGKPGESGGAFVGHVLNYIRENLGSDLSLTALSELVYLNPSYLSRRFKEITGRNLTDTILELRMEEACRLLRNTAGRVKNIAAGLGYGSAAHFSRIFKKEMGITPQEYRDGTK